jgi:hypothetical protein
MLLQTALSEIAEEGGRVISVTWQPSRTVTRADGTASVDCWIYDSVGALITTEPGSASERERPMAIFEGPDRNRNIMIAVAVVVIAVIVYLYGAGYLSGIV